MTFEKLEAKKRKDKEKKHDGRGKIKREKKRVGDRKPH